MNVKTLIFIDESGESFPSRYKKSPFFVLTGCIIYKERLEEASVFLDHIKFKYWRTTDIVFHSIDIGRKDRSFSVFKNNQKLFNEFIEDLYLFLNGKCPLSVIGVVTDMTGVFKKNWKQSTVVRKSYSYLISNYVRYLCTNRLCGEIVQEASTTMQDIIIYEQFYNLQSTGIPLDNISNEEVKERLTSLSFVTKRNKDAITQVADLLSFGILLDYKIRHRILEMSRLNQYEKMIRKAAKNKLYRLDPNMKVGKKEKLRNFSVIQDIS